MIESILSGVIQVIKDVFTALLPLLIIFVIFQKMWLKLPRRLFHNILKGFIFAFAGLVFFLQGVQIGFFSIGVALTPVLSVLILGYLYEKKQKEVDKSYEDQDELTGGDY